MKRLALTLGSALALAAPAAAQTAEKVAEELRTSGVYAAEDAEMALTSGQERDLEDRMRLADRRIFIAVLPASAGRAERVLEDLREAVGERGTYAVIAGRSFRAASDVFAPSVVPTLARQAFERRRDEGAAATLREFVSLVVREEERTAVPAGTPPPGPERDGGTNWGLWALLAAGAGGVALYLRRKRARAAAELGTARELTEEDLVALAEDVQALETEVAGNPAAEARYRRALELYGEASARFDRVRDERALTAVTSLVDDGRHAMAAARAELEGLPVPERRPPCFFDPRHGSSVRDVVWSPPFGGERPVPACAACALRIEEGGEPRAREVAYGGRRVPYWESPAAAPWAAGYFGFGLLPALLVGSMLGAGMGMGYPSDASAEPGGFDDFGGGDFGDGDFGGGADFGGGDF